MSIELYLAFLMATVILVLIPGPNVALVVANSVAHGTRYGLLTVAGTTSAMSIQLVLTVLGMTTMLVFMADAFAWLRWVGVAYLIYLGLRTWTAAPVDLTHVRPQPRSPRATYLRGFLVAITNPKTLLFFGAFLPQFVDPKADVTRQLVILSVSFILVAGSLDCVWALAAARFRAVLAMRGRLRNRLTGSLLIGAGLGLAMARRS